VIVVCGGDGERVVQVCRDDGCGGGSNAASLFTRFFTPLRFTLDSLVLWSSSGPDSPIPTRASLVLAELAIEEGTSYPFFTAADGPRGWRSMVDGSGGWKRERLAGSGGRC